MLPGQLTISPDERPPRRAATSGTYVFTADLNHVGVDVEFDVSVDVGVERDEDGEIVFRYGRLTVGDTVLAEDGDDLIRGAMRDGGVRGGIAQAVLLQLIRDKRGALTEWALSRLEEEAA